MKYMSKDGKQEVEVVEFIEDTYVRFRLNNIVLTISKKRFDKLYQIAQTQINSEDSNVINARKEV